MQNVCLKIYKSCFLTCVQPIWTISRISIVILAAILDFFIKLYKMLKMALNVKIQPFIHFQLSLSALKKWFLNKSSHVVRYRPFWILAAMLDIFRRKLLENYLSDFNDLFFLMSGNFILLVINTQSRWFKECLQSFIYCLCILHRFIQCIQSKFQHTVNMSSNIYSLYVDQYQVIL